MNRIASSLKGRLKALVAKSDPRETIHFLHIGKCAGTQIKTVAAAINEGSHPFRIIKHSHDTYIRDIPPDERFFFATRNPISRFRSGFYSRKRRGRPVHDFEWSSGETLAYERFEHANDLAEALFIDGETGRRAFMAMKSIRHAAQDQVDWFSMFGDVFVTRPPIWIIRQEHFAQDLAVLSRQLGTDLGALIERPAEESAALHANDYSGTPGFSDLAKQNLARWYAQDLEFYRMCEAWIAAQGEGEAFVQAGSPARAAVTREGPANEPG